MIFRLKNSAKVSETESQGFALLFAVLASSVLIALGVSIATISFKEEQITTSEAASQAAYYAADSAAECAIYWDVKMGAFPACLDASCMTVSTSTNNTITCNGIPITVNFTGGASNNNTYSYSSSTFFQYSTTSVVMPNAGILINKQYITTSGSVETTITAEGVNTGIVGRRVERGVSQTYNSY